MPKPHTELNKRAPFQWADIDTVLLDMDGTLLDKFFDDYFWEQYVPQQYAKKNGCSVDQATDELMARYRSVESTLNWTDLGYWTAELELDIPQLKRDIDHLIDVHPFVTDFLTFLSRRNKPVHLVTAAHNTTLEIKMNKTSLSAYFDSIICAEDIGLPKEDPAFWGKLQEQIGFDKHRTLLADDTEKVLSSAQTYGVGQLIHVARSSSRSDIRYSDTFPSIVFFSELIF
jgi:putative hydrolase of the HAD superfamily